MDIEKPDDDSRRKVPVRRWRRAVVATSVLGGMLFSGAAILPTVVMNSTYRDGMLNSRLEELGLNASSISGSGSWLTPISFDNLEVSDKSGQVRLTVKSIRTSLSLLSVVTNGGDLGKVTIVEPVLSVTVDENGNLPLKFATDSKDTAGWDMEFEVQDAALQLWSPWRKLPFVDLVNVDIQGAVKTTDEGRWLTLDPVQIFDRVPLSESHTEQNLALIAPVLAQSTSLSGHASVQLEATKIRMDDGAFSPFSIRGHAVFHEVDAKLKKEWASDITQLLGQATGQHVPDRLQIARDSVVTFEVDAVGIHHHGLAFLLPDVASQMHIESSGMVGLDESLDLVLGLQFPQVVPSNPLMSAFSRMVRNPFQLQVKGTVSEPELVTPPGFSVVDQLSRNVAPERHTEDPQPVSGAVFELISDAVSPDKAQAQQDLPGSILRLIRSIGKAREDAPAKQKPARESKGKKRKNRL